jgi:signal transduction histidine kinase/CheY-like chemotaxis protein
MVAGLRYVPTLLDAVFEYAMAQCDGGTSDAPMDPVAIMSDDHGSELGNKISRPVDSDNYLAEATELSEDIVLVISSNLTVLQCNNESSDTDNIAVQPGSSVLDNIHHEDHSEIRAIVDKVVQSGSMVKRRLRHRMLVHTPLKESIDSITSLELVKTIWVQTTFRKRKVSERSAAGDTQVLMVSRKIEDPPLNMNTNGVPSPRSRGLFEKSQEQERLNEAKLRYITCTAHDLKTPLQSFGFVIDLLANTDTDDEQKELIGQALVSVDLMRLTISQTMDISKTLSGKNLQPRRSTISVSDVVNRVGIVINGYGSSVPVTYEIEDMIDYIITDEEWLWQMILNLLTNACKYTTDGWIRVSVSCVEEEVEKSSGLESNKMLLVQVADTGMGVEEDKIPHLFDAFSQTQKGQSVGTGLGLFGLKARVEGLKGSCGMHPNTEHGSGSVFWFKIPFVADTAHDPSMSDEEAEYIQSMSRSLSREGVHNSPPNESPNSMSPLSSQDMIVPFDLSYDITEAVPQRAVREASASKFAPCSARSDNSRTMTSIEVGDSASVSSSPSPDLSNAQDNICFSPPLRHSTGSLEGLCQGKDAGQKNGLVSCRRLPQATGLVPPDNTETSPECVKKKSNSISITSKPQNVDPNKSRKSNSPSEMKKFETAENGNSGLSIRRKGSSMMIDAIKTLVNSEGSAGVSAGPPEMKLSPSDQRLSPGGKLSPVDAITREHSATSRSPRSPRMDSSRLEYDKVIKYANDNELSAIIVDDSASIRKLMIKVLLQLGFAQVDAHENGKKGLDAIMANEVDVVFSDVQMPVMSGPEVGFNLLSFINHVYTHIRVYVYIYKTHMVYILFNCIGNIRTLTYLSAWNILDGDAVSTLRK